MGKTRRASCRLPICNVADNLYNVVVVVRPMFAFFTKLQLFPLIRKTSSSNSNSMFYDFLLFLPASVSFLYFVMLSRRVNKTNPQKILMWMMLFMSAYLFGDAIYILPGSQYSTNVIADMISAFTTPLIPYCGYLLLRSVLNGRPHQHIITTVFSLMVIYTAVLLVVASISGFDNLIDLQRTLSEENHTFYPLEGLGGMESLPIAFRNPVFMAYLLLTRPIYFALIVAGMIAALSYIVYVFIQRRVRLGQLYKFAFRGQSISSFYLVSCLFLIFIVCGVFRIVVGVDRMSDSPLISIIYSLIESFDIYVLGYVGLIVTEPRYNWKYISQQFSFEKAEHEDSMEGLSLKERKKQEQGVMPLPDDADRLLDGLKKLMEEDQLFLNPDLTIEDVAAELNTNRVYISRVVNQLMHTTFRDYVNQLRIRYSKQYMRKHPDYTQETVAVACGYQDAASFNRKFRQVTGLTPRGWMTKGTEEQEQQ